MQNVLGVMNVTEYISFEEQVKLDHTSFIDGYIEATHVMIEQKSLDKDLRKGIKQSDGTLLTPFQQAKRYASELPYSKRPLWVMTCNFSEFIVYDMGKPNCEPEQIFLKNLPKEYYRLQFLVDSGVSIFSSKIKCGECECWFGAKVWLSTSEKYRKVIYRCNHKYGKQRCNTPYIMEEEIKTTFLNVLNLLLKNRDELIVNVKLICEKQSDTIELETERKQYADEMSLIADMMEAAMLENAHVAFDHDE